MRTEQEPGFGPAVSSFEPDCTDYPPQHGTAGRKGSSAGKPAHPKIGAFERIVQLCSAKDRSSKELADRLTGEGYTAEERSRALERACRCLLVDDARFADALIRTRMASGKGLRAIEQELNRHGIDCENMQGWPQDYGIDENQQLTAAIDLLERRPPKAKDQWSAAYRKLLSKGYSGSVAYRAAWLWTDRAHPRK